MIFNYGFHFLNTSQYITSLTYFGSKLDDLCLGDACHQLTNAEGRPNTEHLKETFDPTTAAPTVVDVVDFDDELSVIEKNIIASRVKWIIEI